MFLSHTVEFIWLIVIMTRCTVNSWYISSVTALALYFKPGVFWGSVVQEAGCAMKWRPAGLCQYNPEGRSNSGEHLVLHPEALVWSLTPFYSAAQPESSGQLIHTMQKCKTRGVILGWIWDLDPKKKRECTLFLFGHTEVSTENRGSVSCYSYWAPTRSRFVVSY